MAYKYITLENYSVVSEDNIIFLIKKIILVDYVPPKFESKL